MVGLLTCIWMDVVRLGQVNSDEAVTGLLGWYPARGEWSMFYWGQSYAGLLEALATASIIRLTGSDLFAFNIVPFVESPLVPSLI